MRAEDSMMHTVLKFLKYKWFISQNSTFFNLQKPPEFLEI